MAATTYQTALHKLDFLSKHCDSFIILGSTTFEGYYAEDAMNSLRFKLRASIAAAYLMSRKFKEVSQLTDSALEHYDWNHRPYDSCTYTWRDYKCDWNRDHALDYLKVHYCKAMALKHEGDTTGAIEHMEKALVFDPGDGQVYTQLSLLKQKREE